MDKGIFEYLGPYGIYKFCRYLHYQLTSTNIIYFHIFYMFLAVVLIISGFLVVTSGMWFVLIRYMGFLPIVILIVIITNNN